MLSCGNTHDSAQAIELLSKIDISESNVLGDKAMLLNQFVRILLNKGLIIQSLLEVVTLNSGIVIGGIIKSDIL